MIRARLRGFGRHEGASAGAEPRADAAGAEPRAGAPAGGGGPDDSFLEIDASELSGVFSAPQWLRDLGIAAWLLIGVLLFVAGLVWLLSLTAVIVLPVITAAIIATVATPVVSWLARHRVPRGVGTALLMLGVVALALGMVVLIVNGVSDQASEIESELENGAGKVQSWAQDAGVSEDKAQQAKQDASKSASGGVKTLLNGVVSGIEGLGGIVVFLSFTVLSLFFLMLDGPRIRAWLESHTGLPDDIARTVSGRTIGSLRGYFVGVTIVAAFNGVVIGLGALLLGVPMAGTIAVINFAAAYIPYLGAWTAGIFTVLMALSGQGTEVAIAMAVIVLLANGILQQMIQPIAYGAALGIHPLAVLVVTIAGGALFGTIGLILAAPLTAAATKISADLARARAAEEQAAGPSPAPGGA